MKRKKRKYTKRTPVAVTIAPVTGKLTRRKRRSYVRRSMFRIEAPVVTAKQVDMLVDLILFFGLKSLSAKDAKKVRSVLDRTYRVGFKAAGGLVL